MRPIYFKRKYLFGLILALGLLIPDYFIAQSLSCELLPSPELEVDVAIVGVDYPQSGACDHFNLLIDVAITNTGQVKLKNISPLMNLEDDFGVVYAALVSGPIYLEGVIGQESMNETFNGRDDINLIKNPEAVLDLGAYTKMRLVIEVAPEEDALNAASKMAKVSARAQADWSDLIPGNLNIDPNLLCYSEYAEDSEALGDCWQKSRIQAANDQINITLAACTALITPDMILENHFPDCDASAYPEGGFYRLKLIGPGDIVLAEGSTITVEDGSIFEAGLAIVMVENVGEACRPLWGYVQLEDKTGVVVADCPSEVYTACVGKDVQILEGTIPAADDPDADLVNFSNYSCFIEDGRLTNCDRTYDLISFEVDKTDIYTFELSMDENAGLTAVFQGSFNPNSPCENIIAQSDVNIFDEAIFPTDDRLEARIRMVLPLRADATYYLLTTHAACQLEEESYSYNVFSDGDGAIVDVEVETEDICYTLLCDDVPYILDNPESLEYLPSPVFADNCTSETDLDVRFSDQLFEQGDCGALYIQRTWTARDEAGNEEAVCEQRIYFSRPSLRDIYKPNATVPIECDEDFANLPNGNPDPSHTGFPYVVSAFGIHDLKDSYCNVGAQYADIGRIDVCEDSYKIIRQWTLVDWCDVGNQEQLNNSPLNNYRQIIKVGDFSAPIIECSGNSLDFTTGPFDCTATVPLIPPKVSDNCSEGWTVRVEVITEDLTPVYDKYGNLVEYNKTYRVLAEGLAGGFASEIPVGSHFFRYTATDNCGNQSSLDCPISVKDAIAPTSVCDDDLHVSIGGQGIAKVTAADLDEGSWDNCTPVGLKASRSFADETCRDQYLTEILGLSFSDLKRISLFGPNEETDIYLEVGENDVVLDTVLRERGGQFLTWWEDEVYFICCDIDQRIGLELLAVDGDGLVSSFWAGTVNGDYCWLELLVEDKIIPECVAPESISLPCTDLPYGFDPTDLEQLAELFGVAEGLDNCPGVLVTELTPSSDLNCNIGKIIRTFEASDAQDKKSINSCVQEIEILARHAYEIKFPKDAVFLCGEAPTPDTATFTELGCDLLSVNVKDDFFEASGEECYKIFRTYKVINWCEYDGEAPPVIVGRDEDCDGKKGDEDVWVLVREDGKVYYDRDNDENNDAPKADIKELSCDEISNPEGHWINSDIDGSASPARNIASNGHWQYTQIIKVFDNEAPIVTIDRNEPFCIVAPDACSAEVFIPFTVDETCGHFRNFSIEVFFDEFADNSNLINVTDRGLIDRFPKYTFKGEYPIGRHIFEVVVSDGCGNTSTMKVPFEVIDCKVAAPSCIHGLSVELMRTEPGTDADGDGDTDAGAMTIWATDFIASSIIDCAEPVTFSINRLGETPNQEDHSLIVTCDDKGVLPVQIYAWDGAYNPYLIQPDGVMGGPNFDFCETVLFVQDNMFDLCSGGARVSVSGLISTEDDEQVENVDLRISGARADDFKTTSDGVYVFDNLTLGGDYTITPNLDEDYNNGVSTFDLVLLTRHILGIERLDSPYKMIAADVNNSQSITALDVLQLRKLILSIDERFINNSSWRFVRANYAFPDPGNPWFEIFPEVISYNDLSSAIATADFIAVKIGDLNLNARPNSLSVANRSVRGEAYLEIPASKAKAEEVFALPFHLAKSNELRGCQFTLEWDPVKMELLDVKYGLAQAGRLGLNYAEEGLLSLSWNRETEQQAEEFLFELSFRANQDLEGVDLVKFKADRLFPEAYDMKDELLDLQLRIVDLENTTPGFQLDQNRPNPFSAETQIGFYLLRADETILSIYDVHGVLIKRLRKNYDAGWRQLTINKSDLPAAGVYYYTLQAGSFMAGRKMIFIE